ncbi:protein tyrosine phosphatase family protein [Ferrimonas balearica]|uniref:protein tyrosine phosphatase family protein n=1 Tax=Ferrimonas balearica TaxID=44012 RepID=UPI001F31E0BB|nr:protein tyrosine phosphatase family protein [Ferrimonas balearica]MBY6018626.1 protein tyrosine phosphatase family protein [Halomonas denitrificans]MBY6096422.1 protein tyrosine phosphatase family protein [Ferrimonas balearica]
MRWFSFAAALTLMPMAHAALPDMTPVQDIRAFQTVSPSLLTAGLPMPADFARLHQAGVEVVINLMPDSSNKAYSNEAELVTDAGMVYVAIPVDWQNPTIDDVDAFFNVMSRYQDKTVLVHCLANFRASAFVYLYQWAQAEQGDKPEMAAVMAPWGDLEQSLKEYPQWAALIEQVKQTHSTEAH